MKGSASCPATADMSEIENVGSHEDCTGIEASCIRLSLEASILLK